MKDKVINDLLKRISDLEFEVEKQEQRIDKAIEFINGGKGWVKLNPTHQEKMLLNILKGSDKG